jgi:hypothetical protein
MSSFPDPSTNAADMPGRQAANAIVAGLQNEIPPDKIARLIRNMVEATSLGPNGAEGPDWPTIEAGVKLYLAFLCPPAVSDSQMAAQPGIRVSNGMASVSVLMDAIQHGVVRKGPGCLQAQQQPAAAQAPRPQLEPLEFMERMMVLDSDTLTSKRDAKGRPVPRHKSPSPASRAAKRRDQLVHLSVFNSVIFRRLSWPAMLAGCVAAVWVAGKSLREPASAQPVERQAGPFRPAPSAAAAIPPPKGEFSGWFIEDDHATYDPTMTE